MKQRLKSDTPKFWKKIQKVGIALTAVGTVLVSANNLPEFVSVIGSYMATAGAVIAALSQLTVSKEPDHKEPEV